MRKIEASGLKAQRKSKAMTMEKYDVENSERLTGERWISMSNALTIAGHGLSLSEKRVIAIAVSKLDSRCTVNTTQPPRTRITASEYAEVAKVSMDTAYDQLQAASKHLFERRITFFEPSYKRNGGPIRASQTVMRWIGQADYEKHEAWVELHWWPPLLPHLMGLKHQFTSYQLQQASVLRSIYSWRLLELLTRFESSGWAEYSIEDFATSMDATEKQRSDFHDIKRRIIEPAVKELIEKDGWFIEWLPIKKGRRVAALRFAFQRNPQGQLQI